jgi:hypothetical protein
MFLDLGICLVRKRFRDFVRPFRDLLVFLCDCYRPVSVFLVYKGVLGVSKCAPLPCFCV